jgi:putative transposase
MKDHWWFFETNWRSCMNTREIADEYRLSHWAQVMHERVEKGLSIRAYCEEIGIHENTYFYWQRKLREAACTRVLTAAAAPEESSAPKGWTALCVSEKPAQSQVLTVELGECRITVCADTDSELLIRVCRALKTL